MQFSEQWLRTYANPAIGSEELAHRLTMAGLEVEDNDPVAPPFTGVVVAHVLSVDKHPNADKLTVRYFPASSSSSRRRCAALNHRACCVRRENWACRKITPA